jgi:hypothetical protein
LYNILFLDNDEFGLFWSSFIRWFERVGWIHPHQN